MFFTIYEELQSHKSHSCVSGENLFSSDTPPEMAATVRGRAVVLCDDGWKKDPVNISLQGEDVMAKNYPHTHSTEQLEYKRAQMNNSSEHLEYKRAQAVEAAADNVVSSTQVDEPKPPQPDQAIAIREYKCKEAWDHIRSRPVDMFHLNSLTSNLREIVPPEPLIFPFLPRPAGPLPSIVMEPPIMGMGSISASIVYDTNDDTNDVFLFRPQNSVTEALNGNQGSWTNGDDMSEKKVGTGKKPKKKKTAEQKKTVRTNNNSRLERQKLVLLKLQAEKQGDAVGLGKVIKGRGDYSMGRNIGSSVGGWIGNKVEGFVRKIFGTGDYSFEGAGVGDVKQNSLLASASVPSFGSKPDGAIDIEFHEFVKNINMTAAFDLETFDIDITKISSFPWLSRMAGQFQQYQIIGLLYFIKTLSSDTVSAPTQGQGSIIGAISYDVNAKPPTNKSEMLNSLFASSAKPSANQVLPLECAPGMTTNPTLKVLPPGLQPPDLQWYQRAKLHIATEGAPNDYADAAELYVVYHIRLLKPRLTGPAGAMFMMDLLCSDGQKPLIPFADTAAVKQPRIDTIGVTLDSNQRKVYLPLNIADDSIWEFKYSTIGPTTVNISPVNVTVAGGLVAANILDDQTQSGYHCPNLTANTGCNSNISVKYYRYDGSGTQNIPPSFDIVLQTPYTFPTGAKGTFFITQMEADTGSGLTSAARHTYSRNNFFDYLCDSLAGEKSRFSPPGENRLVDWVSYFRKESQFIIGEKLPRVGITFDCTLSEAVGQMSKLVRSIRQVDDSKEQPAVDDSVADKRHNCHQDEWTDDENDQVFLKADRGVVTMRMRKTLNGNNGSHTNTDDVEEKRVTPWSWGDEVTVADKVIAVNPQGMTGNMQGVREVMATRVRAGWKLAEFSMIKTSVKNAWLWMSPPKVLDRRLRAEAPTDIWTVDKLRKVQCYCIHGTACTHEFKDCPGYASVSDQVVDAAHPAVRNALNGANGSFTGTDDVDYAPCERDYCGNRRHWHKKKRGGGQAAKKGGAQRIARKKASELQLCISDQGVLSTMYDGICSADINGPHYHIEEEQDLRNEILPPIGEDLVQPDRVVRFADEPYAEVQAMVADGVVDAQIINQELKQELKQAPRELQWNDFDDEDWKEIDRKDDLPANRPFVPRPLREFIPNDVDYWRAPAVPPVVVPQQGILRPVQPVAFVVPPPVAPPRARRAPRPAPPPPAPPPLPPPVPPVAAVPPPLAPPPGPPPVPPPGPPQPQPQPAGAAIPPAQPVVNPQEQKDKHLRNLYNKAAMLWLHKDPASSVDEAVVIRSLTTIVRKDEIYESIPDITTRVVELNNAACANVVDARIWGAEEKCVQRRRRYGLTRIYHWLKQSPRAWWWNDECSELAEKEAIRPYSMVKLNWYEIFFVTAVGVIIVVVAYKGLKRAKRNLLAFPPIIQEEISRRWHAMPCRRWFMSDILPYYGPPLPPLEMPIGEFNWRQPRQFTKDVKEMISFSFETAARAGEETRTSVEHRTMLKNIYEDANNKFIDAPTVDPRAARNAKFALITYAVCGAPWIEEASKRLVPVVLCIWFPGMKGGRLDKALRFLAGANFGRFESDNNAKMSTVREPFFMKVARMCIHGAWTTLPYRQGVLAHTTWNSVVAVCVLNEQHSSEIGLFGTALPDPNLQFWSDIIINYCSIMGSICSIYFAYYLSKKWKVPEYKFVPRITEDICLEEHKMPVVRVQPGFIVKWGEADCRTAIGVRGFWGIEGYVGTVFRSCHHNEKIALCGRVGKFLPAHVDQQRLTQIHRNWLRVTQTTLDLFAFLRMPFQYEPVEYVTWCRSFMPGRRDMLLGIARDAHDMPALVAKSFIKKEVCVKDVADMTFKDPRWIQGCPPELSARVGPYLRNWAHGFRDTVAPDWTPASMRRGKQIVYTCGLNAHQIGAAFAKAIELIKSQLNAGERIAFLEDDQSRFDLHMLSGPFHMLYKVYRTYLPRKVAALLVRRTSRGVSNLGTKYSIPFTMQSGWPDTSLGDSITNAAMKYSIHGIGRRWISIICGDDSVTITTTAELARLGGVANITASYAAFGMEIEAIIRDDPLDVEFCSGRFYPCQETYILMPRIGKMLSKICWDMVNRNTLNRFAWLRSIGTTMREYGQVDPLLMALGNMLQRFCGEGSVIDTKDAYKYYVPVGLVDTPTTFDVAVYYNHHYLLNSYDIAQLAIIIESSTVGDFLSDARLVYMASHDL